MSTLRFLNSTESAERFMTLAGTDSGARALLGDADKYEDTEASAAIVNANSALKDGVRTIEKLAKDETRTPPQRNDVAAQVADRVVKQLESSKAVIDRRISSLWDAGVNEATTAFRPELSRSAYDAQIMQFVREESTKQDGILKVHELVKSNANVAAVVFNSEPFLLGIANKTYESMKFDAIKTHAPNAWAKMERSADMTKLPEQYDRAIAGVRSSFFNPAERLKMGSRVEL